MTGIRAKLAADLRSVTASEQLFPLAARSRAEAATADAAGVFLVAHALLLLVAQKIDGEPLGEPEWLMVRNFLTRLADYVVDGTDRTLDLTAAQWRAWANPVALH